MIKPYYETELGKLYLGDCLEILPGIEQVDTVITDPVWPNAIPVLKGADNPYGLFTSAVKKLPKSIKRIAVHLGCDSDPRILAPIPSRLVFFRVAWLRYAFPHPKGRLLYSGDVAYFFGKPPKSRPGRQLISGEYTDTCNAGKQSDHPCPRKLKHVAWIIDRWAQKDDIVLDPFLGSGTTAVACEQLGVRWIGIEVDKEYCDMTIKRIEQERSQLKLRLGESL